MEAQPYGLNARGAIQIMPKSEMRKQGLTSPDELDAAIMAGVDLSPWTGNPYNKMNEGSAFISDREDLPFMSEELPMFGAGLPLL